MKTELLYKEAQPEDAGLLTSTVYESKKNWGYSDELMAAWKSDLEVSANYILANKVVKVFVDSVFIGFFALKLNEDNSIEIDHLWLLPDKIRKGYGQKIFEYIVCYLKSRGYTKTTLVAEPNAKGFYEKMGGIVSGQFQSKVSGRWLDIYEFEI